jgi:hypothetical protein
VQRGCSALNIYIPPTQGQQFTAAHPRLERKDNHRQHPDVTPAGWLKFDKQSLTFG